MVIVLERNVAVKHLRDLEVSMLQKHDEANPVQTTRIERVLYGSPEHKDAEGGDA